MKSFNQINKIRKLQGFTLVELLVVISIIAVLLAVLMPALTKARMQAQRITCASGLKQLTTGFMMYAEAYNGKLPPTTDVTNDSQTVFFKFMRAETANFYPKFMPSKEIFYCPNVIKNRFGPKDKTYGYENWPYNIGYSIFIDKNVSVYPTRIMSINVKNSSFAPLISDLMCFDPSKNTWWESPFVAHPGKKGQPLGGNVTYFDGHSVWLSYVAKPADPRKPWERNSTQNWEGALTGSELTQFVPRWD